MRFMTNPGMSRRTGTACFPSEATKDEPRLRTRPGAVSAPAIDLHQLHEGNRPEKMQSQKPLRMYKRIPPAG
jgi:hypothetical protein